MAAGRMQNFVLFFLLIPFVMLSCDFGKTTQFTRLDAAKTGIDFVNENHETEKSNILTYEYFYNGGGVAIGDINNDGLADVYLTSNIYENKLYLNKGNFEFEDITESSGTGCKVGWKTGVSMVDINSDGLLDIYVCRSASPDPSRRKNILLVNNGNNTFTDKASEYNLDDDSYTTQAAFFDFDRDDDLDVILLNHSILDISNSFLITRRNSTVRYPHVGNKLLKNENGKFMDVSDSMGVYGPASNYGLGVSLSDVNNDGWIDVYTGCDYTGRDKLLINQSGKFFADATDSLSHISKFTMGTEIADVNGDGWMDIFTVDMLPEDNRRQKQLFGTDRYDVFANMVGNGLHHQYMRNMLHVNHGNGSFSEAGQLAGISNTDWSWASLFADFDNDGVQDLFISNGFKRDLTDNDFTKFKAFQEITAARKEGKNASFLEVIGKLSENKIPNYCFRGNGNLSFDNVTAEWGLSEPALTNGVAYGDLDNDGDLDLVTNNINEQAGVYRNNAEAVNKNSYLEVQLTRSGKNCLAYGARVTVYANGNLYVREQLPVRGFQSSVDQRLHFGLGKATVIDSIRIGWPDGTTHVIKKVVPNQILKISNDSGVVAGLQQTATPTYFIPGSPISFTHRENDFVDFRIQALLPRMYSREGPAMASADVNGDGLMDVFIGGPKDQPSGLWLKQRNGSYKTHFSKCFEDNKSESVDATFFDADSDGDQDLYVVTGGYEFSENDPLLKDQLYLNAGGGNFVKGFLPEYLVSGSCVKAADIDSDGDQDLFVGGMVVAGKFPVAPESAVLVNDGKGNFTLSQNIPESLKHAGMVCDAAWVDLDNDKSKDLVIVGEWMPVKVFMNEKGMLVERSAEYIDADSHGLWNCILADDFDGDGDTDMIIGNQGLNTQMKPSPEQPVTMVYDDFDNNGSIDPIVTYYIMGKAYPYPTRDELTEQLPTFKKRFTDYKSYSNAQIEDVLPPEELARAKKLKVSMATSSFVRNDSGRLVFEAMPLEMQMAPVMSMALMDVDGDGIQDVVTGGNISATRARSGKMSGNHGFVFRNDGKGNFKFLPPQQSGIHISSDVRKVISQNGELIFAVNNGPVVTYRLAATMKGNEGPITSRNVH
jgi:enediyne biosynthesis protein E4